MRRSWFASAALSLLLPAVFRGQTPKSPESFEQVAARARAAMDAEHVPEAIGLFERATQLRPQWTEGWWYLGALLYDAGRFERAREAFGQFVKLERQQPGPGYAMLGLSAFQLKRYEEALGALERGRQLGLGSNPVFRRSVLYHVGILDNLLGQPELAVKRLTLAANYIAEAHPEGPQQAVLADRELVDALGMAALRIPKLPAGLPPSQTGMVRLAGRAQALIAMQDRVAADLEFKQLLALYPAEPGVHYFYGVFLLKEHPELASAEFHKELEISPTNAAARIQIAFERLNAADYEQGLKYAREAIALTPKDFAAHVICGRLYLALGKTEGALEELQTAVKLAPDSPDAHFALSRALAQAGRPEEAARERAEFEKLRAEVDAADKRSGQ
jgi:tetratricopeptide (TPR) repeat protein